jgi:EYS protein
MCTKSLWLVRFGIEIKRICEYICLENNGICVHETISETYKCLCTYGYSGQNCSENLNQSFCSSHPCMNNGTCLESPTSPDGICRCEQGFGGRFCDEIVKCGEQECLFPSQVCLADSCVNVTGELYCLLHECQHDGICDPLTRECQCQKGFSGLNCELKSLFCDQTTNVCQNNGTCIATQSRCLCTNYFTGKYCEIYSMQPEN